MTHTVQAVVDAAVELVRVARGPAHPGLELIGLSVALDAVTAEDMAEAACDQVVNELLLAALDLRRRHPEAVWHVRGRPLPVPAWEATRLEHAVITYLLIDHHNRSQKAA
jgi:hypothetical protein